MSGVILFSIPPEKRAEWSKELASALEGTLDNASITAERLFGVDLEEEDAEDLALDANVERCGECRWWMESCMLHENSRGKFVCDDCEPEDDD